MSYIWVGIVVVTQCLAMQAASADRTVAPIDFLGDWAIESNLQCCGPWEHGHVYLSKSGDKRLLTLAASLIELEVRVWPVRGLFLGIKGGSAGLGDEESREWAEEQGEAERTFTDLGLDTGYRKRLSPSVVVGASTHLSLGTGTAWATKNRTDVEGRALLGFSFTPRWDFYFEPRAGIRSASTLSAEGHRAGWSAGFSYQQARFNLTAYGGNMWHRDSNTADISTLGGFSIGYEVSPGWNLAFRLDGDGDRNGVTGAEFVGRRASKGKLVGGFAIHWVFYPGDRRNRLRKPDSKRGRDWKLWNPGQPL